MSPFLSRYVHHHRRRNEVKVRHGWLPRTAAPFFRFIYIIRGNLITRCCRGRLECRSWVCPKGHTRTNRSVYASKVPSSSRDPCHLYTNSCSQISSYAGWSSHITTLLPTSSLRATFPALLYLNAISSPPPTVSRCHDLSLHLHQL